MKKIIEIITNNRISGIVCLIAGWFDILLYIFKPYTSIFSIIGGIILMILAIINLTIYRNDTKNKLNDIP